MDTDPTAGSGSLLPGPYGTNEGDSWLAADYFQERVKADKGESFAVIIEMMRDEETGELDEHIYVTEVPELVEAAKAGHEKWIAAQAAKN